MSDAHELVVETVALDDLKPHPRNYREHPDDELEHIRESIRRHGIYRNVVIASDGTILAGHGVVEAARSLGMTTIAVRRLPLGPDDPQALALLVGDNEIAQLGVRDERALAGLLSDVGQVDVAALVSTGYDAASLDALLASFAPTIPTPSEQREPTLASDCLIEIRCSNADRDDFAPMLADWGQRDGVQIDIS